MSTWFPRIERSWLERIAIRVLQNGHIPNHLAFIMDGNRRYAEKLDEERTAGHSHGFEKLAETLSWCRDIGITKVTLYAFSIENFKRPKNEVDFLMELFRKQANKLMEEFEKIEQNEICIRIYGRIDLLPIDVQQTMARIVLKTSRFDRFQLNICFSYTAREEITNAMNDLKECVENHIINPCDINYHTMNNALYSQGVEDPEILIRTSGEIRLSDFLLWQSSFSSLFFIDALWPELTIWHLFYAILNYQYQRTSIMECRRKYFDMLEQEDLKYCQEFYKNNFPKKRINGEFKSSANGYVKNFDEFMQERQTRIERCYQWIKEKRLRYLQALLSSEKILNQEINHDSDCNEIGCNNNCRSSSL